MPEPSTYRYVDASYAHLESTRVDAEAIVPVVLDLVPARSVIDLGCGIGTWLSVFREQGVTEVVGVDGPWVDRARLVIPEREFVAADLTFPFALERTFDLAVCTETAEHLPPESAASLVDALARLAPVVLFSAAVPHVPGNRHVNCQWPSYWVRQFRERRFAASDGVRRRIWSDRNVRWFYAQSMLLFISEDVLAERPRLAAETLDVTNGYVDVIHPGYYLSLVARG